MRRWPFAAAVLAALVVAACTNAGPGTECSCAGGVPEGALETTCGTTQCVGGALYRCTGANTAVREGSCGGPAPNPRPAGTPDVVFVAVSGHCLAPCPYDYNDEYLFSGGTIDVLAQPFLDSGYAVEAVPISDNFYDQEHAYGFLTLVQTLLDMREQLVGSWDNPTRFIVVGHSHGTVWAHLALMVLEEWGVPLPVDVLVDIDGLSLGWEDKVLLGFGDAWAPLIRAHMAETGQTWPFDIANASDSVTIPGQDYLQDVEDLLPNSVAVNLEIWSSDGTLPEPVRDSQANHRYDGSERDILWFRSAENHENSDNPGSDTVDWVVGELVALYQ
jgi:hypothetical protein